MKLNHMTTIIAILASLLLATACEEEAAETTEETPSAETPAAEEESTEEQPAAEEPAAEQPAAQAEGEGGGAGDSVCGRAVTCCEAYVNAVSATTPGVTAETACAGVRQAGNAPGGDATCTAAISGWRQSLTALNQTVPASCAE